MAKRLPTMQETQVQSPGREDPLEKEMATHSSTLAWRIPWMEECGRLQSMRSQSQTRLSDFTFLFSFILKEGRGRLVVADFLVLESFVLTAVHIALVTIFP